MQNKLHPDSGRGRKICSDSILKKAQQLYGVTTNKKRQPKWKQGFKPTILFHPDGVAKIVRVNAKRTLKNQVFSTKCAYELYLGSREKDSWDLEGVYNSVIEAKAACGESIGPLLKKRERNS